MQVCDEIPSVPSRVVLRLYSKTSHPGEVPFGYRNRDELSIRWRVFERNDDRQKRREPRDRRLPETSELIAQRELYLTR